MPELEDVFLDVNGEIAVGSNGDLKIARNADVIEQEVIWRLKTAKGDWMLEPQDGADLETLIGFSITPATLTRMENMITESLTNDGYFDANIRQVLAVPLGVSTVQALVEVEFGEHTFFTDITLDLKEGIL